MTEFYNIIDVEVNGAIDNVMDEVNFNGIIEQLENITTEANKYIFKIYNHTVDIKNNFKTFQDDFGESDLEKFKERCVNDDLIKKIELYSNNNCDDDCKKSIKEYFEKNKNLNNIEKLISSIELLKNSTGFTLVSYPYSSYKVFVEEYSKTIKETTDDEKQNQIISFYYYYYHHIL